MRPLLIGLLVFSLLGGCKPQQKATSQKNPQQLEGLGFTEWLLKGQAAYAKKNLAEALVAYEKLIVLEPESAIAYNNRGTVYQAQGNLVAAIADYTRAIQIDHQFAGAYHNRGTVYLAQGLIELAIGDWKKACLYGSSRTCDYIKVHNL